MKVTFDPKQVTYGKLLQIFFSVVADPTTLNYQGNDHGTSYRSAFFTMNDEQKKVADAYVAQLDAAKVFPAKIVTEVTPYTNFYQAEDYHQDNATTLKVNPGYIQFFDLPEDRQPQGDLPGALARQAGAGLRVERVVESRASCFGRWRRPPAVFVAVCLFAHVEMARFS